MYTITDEQIDFILADIKQNGIDTEDLQLNLLDHICCILEQEVGVDDDFAASYKRVARQFYKRELSEIEEETKQLLQFKNYYAMKRLMLISGAISAAAFIGGSILKIMAWPGASALLFLGVVILSFLFLPLLVLLKTREADTRRNKLVLILGAVVGMLYSLSTLFAMMHWPGATSLWLTTVIMSIGVLVPTYFFTGIRQPETKVNTIVTTILLVSATGLLFTMLRIRQPLPLQSYNYIKNEQLLKKMQRNLNNVGDTNNKLVADINTACDSLKGIILSKDIARTTIPEDAEQKEIIIAERNVYMPETSEAFALLEKLRVAVSAYNAVQTANDNKISTAHTVLEIAPDKLNTCTNFFVLNSLTQMQLSLVSNAQHPVLTMK